MRIRSIKPEFWRSDDIDALDWDTRLVFIGLWSYVDDNGVGVDKLASICADLFAGDLERDPSGTFARVSRGLQSLSERALIARYTADGKSYLHVTNWDAHQRIDRPNKPRHPLPTSANAVVRDTLATPSRDSRESPAPGTEEQRNRGTEEQTSSSAKTPTPEVREDVEALCLLLRDRIVENGNRPPNITAKWRTEARLLLDKDGIELSRALALIDWCQADSFWKANVLSMPKFREKYDQLRSKALEEHRRKVTPITQGSTADQRVAQAQAAKAAIALRMQTDPKALLS